MSQKPTPPLPQGWTWVRLGDLLTESLLPGTDGLRARKLTVKLYGRGIQEKSEKRPGSDKTRYYERRAGQFIYSKLDFLNGAFAIIPPHLDGYESTVDLPAFDVSEAVSPQYLLYYVSRPEFYAGGLISADGTRKARRVHPSEFLNLSIPLPPLPVQRWIADALASVDEWLEVSGEASSVDQDVLRLVVKQLTTPPKNAGETWETKRLSEICSVGSGTTPSRRIPEYFAAEGTPWVKTTDLNEDWIENTEESLTAEGLRAYRRKPFLANSVLLAMYGGFNQIGRTAMLRHPSTTNQALSVLEKLTVNPRYVLYHLQSNIFYWKRIAASSRKDANITKGDVEDYPISFPISKDEQAAIVQKVDALKVLNSSTSQQLPELKKLKNSLLHQLLSGSLEPQGGWASIIHEAAP